MKNLPIWICRVSYDAAKRFRQLSLPFLFFVPDVFAIGYFISRPVGAWMYNFSHHKMIALALVAAGLFTNDYWTLAGLMAYAHSSFDRAIGYGLKYVDTPDHTHLGFIGKQKSRNAADHF